MQPLTVHTGRTAVLRRDDVDTDQIIPADCCRSVGRTGFSYALFARWRREPDFVLNDPAVTDATVLIAGPNFGTGSSREHAVWALRDWGFAAVIAPSFGDIFRRNALKNGLLAVALPAGTVVELMDIAERARDTMVTVDLTDHTVRVDGRAWAFDIDQRARWLLLNGLDEIDVTLSHDRDITGYERRRPAWLPRIDRHQAGELAG